MNMKNRNFKSLLILIPILIVVSLLVQLIFKVTGSTVAATSGIAGGAIFGWMTGRVTGAVGGVIIGFCVGINMAIAGLKPTDVSILTKIGGTTFIVMTALAMGTMRHFFDRLKFEISRRQKAEHKLIKLNDQLSDEKERSERLLLNVLPLSISNRLKENPTHIADTYPEATILFADIVDFTRISSGISPNELVHDLNNIFTVFDELTVRFGLEKIKTIGDSYMAVSGLPDPQVDHEERAADMALEMIKASENMTIGGVNVNFRIGINSGEVTAGVIGSVKFLYDLWGDAVNTASRMESASEPNQILVPKQMYESLLPTFNFSLCGTKEIKGKGAIKTYFLEGRK